MRVRLLCFVLILAACGTGGQTSSASPAEAVTPTPSAVATPTTNWLSYSDPDYRFSVLYPPSFTFERQHGVTGTGLLMAYRAVDPVYQNSEPPGQLEIAIYSKDADTLTGWVAKHSGPPTSPDLTRYWIAATNQSPVTVNGQPGLAFDWVPDTGARTVHATACFLGTAYVIVLQWWSTDPSYAPTLQQYYQQMLAGLKK
jgi:hypothetical protein